MNWEQIEGRWQQLAGRVKARWAQLTDDDIAEIRGRRQELVGRLQQRYGLAKERAEQEVEAFRLAAHDFFEERHAPKR
jgi:uncharacterized protein YjbJ (UPF0337 family)